MSRALWFGFFILCGGLAIRWLDRVSKADQVSKDWLTHARYHEDWQKQLIDGVAWKWPVKRD